MKKVNGKRNSRTAAKTAQKAQANKAEFNSCAPEIGQPPKEEAVSRETKKIIDKGDKKIYVVDTNVLIDDPGATDILIDDGNLVVVPITVINELNGLKKEKPEAQLAIKRIYARLLKKDPSLVIETQTAFVKWLNPLIADDQIIATYNYVLSSSRRASSGYGGYSDVRLVTGDISMTILALTVLKSQKPIVEDYRRNKVEIVERDLLIPRYRVSARSIVRNGNYFFFPAKGKLKAVANGEAIVAISNATNLETGETGEWQESFCAVRRNDHFLIMDSSISASGVRPMHNGTCNWAQIIAMNFLCDNSVSCVFLQGGAGTGKTLLALASALESKKSGFYDQVIISRPVVPLEEKQQMGFLPGDISQKMNPWLLPIEQNLRFITQFSHSLAPLKKPEPVYEEEMFSKRGRHKKDDHGRKQKGKQRPQPVKAPVMKKTVQSFSEILDANGLLIQSLDYIRGATFSKSFIIIDEAQNLTAHQIKTIITRVGKGTKIVFTGDLGQIDGRLNRNTSGLAYAIKKFSRNPQLAGAKNPMIAIVNFSATLRSDIASLAEKIL